MPENEMVMNSYEPEVNTMSKKKKHAAKKHDAKDERNSYGAAVRREADKRDNATKMTDMIAKIAGNSVSDSRFFDWEPGMKMLYCDILLRLYFSENYYVAVQIIDLIFYILNMYDTGKVVAVAAAGASEDNCKAFLDKYYDRIDLLGEYETLMPGLVAEWL